MSDTRDISDAVRDLSEDRSLIAFTRALKTCGIDHQMGDDGLVVVDFDDVHDNKDFEEVYGLELKLMVVRDIKADLLEEGIIEASYIADDGEVIHRLTDEAREHIDSMLGEL